MRTSIPTGTDGAPLDISRILRPVQRRLGLTLALCWILRGVTLLLVVSAASVLSIHLAPWPDTRLAIVGMVVLSGAVTLATAVLVLRRWPGPAAAALIADRQLQLKDRLTTALEYRGQNGALLRLQRDELRERLHGVNLARAATIRVPRLDLAICLLALCLLAGASASPDQQARAAHERDQQRAAASIAARQVTQELARLQRQAGRQTQATRQQAALLRQLQAGLRQAANTPAALKALAGAQQRLQQMVSSGVQAQRTLQALARALQNGPASRVGKALAGGSSATTAAALRSLDRQLSRLSPAQRQNVAQSLEQAANGAPANLRDALRNVAFHLADNNPAAARQDLRSIAQAITTAQAKAAAGQSAATEQQRLQHIKQQAANGTQTLHSTQKGAARSASQTGHPSKAAGVPRSGVTKPGASGAKRTGASGSSNSAHARGAQRARASAGSASNTGSKAGTSSTQGQPGRAGAGVAGSASGAAGAKAQGGGQPGGSGGGEAARRTAGSYESIYLPGKLGSGPSTTTSATAGTPVPVRSARFRHLLPRYTAQAQLALERSAVPPAMRDAVKRYFQSLDSSG